MKILVPLDCASHGQAVVQFCSSMPNVLDSIIILTHVAPLPGSVDRGGVERAEHYVSEIARPLRAAGAHVLYMLRRGDPATEIVALARMLEADLIVMLARRKQRHGDRQLGGVIEAVVLHAEQPVVTINDVVSAGTALPGRDERTAA
ncbi:MAG: universal stress protein [Chloroflexi bacterium]|nr:universal stress protein [Chloroflexota bacterium]